MFDVKEGSLFKQLNSPFSGDGDVSPDGQHPSPQTGSDNQRELKIDSALESRTGYQQNAGKFNERGVCGAQMGRTEEAARTRAASVGPPRPGRDRARARRRRGPVPGPPSSIWDRAMVSRSSWVPRGRGETAGRGLGGAGLLLAANGPASPRLAQPAGPPSGPRGVPAITRARKRHKRVRPATRAVRRRDVARGMLEPGRRTGRRRERRGRLAGPAPARSAPAPSPRGPREPSSSFGGRAASPLRSCSPSGRIRGDQ